MLLLLLVVVVAIVTSSAFLAVSENKRSRRQLTSTLFQTAINDRDLYISSFDGTLASMTEYRSKVAIKAAFMVWPSLYTVVEELGMNTCLDNFASSDDFSWLLNKLRALSSITQQGDSPDEMLGCDEVFLTRILLEEQLLDDGRSSGRGGKYGGKFHPNPSITSSRSTRSVGQKSKVGSRPLTVGEIFANWSELREVAHNKYPFMRRSHDNKLKMTDPLPEIRRVLRELYACRSLADLNTTPKLWYPFASDILANKNSKNVLLLGNKAFLEMALSSLERLDLTLEIHSHLECLDSRTTMENFNEDTMKVMVTNSTSVWQHVKEQQDVSGHSILILVPDTLTEEPQSDLIQSIVRSATLERDNINRNIYVVHSSLDVLKSCKRFLGDDAPILSHGLSKCIIGNDTVTLFLPSWSQNVHPTQLNDAEMDPWLNVISENLFEELTSAMIV